MSDKKFSDYFFIPLKRIPSATAQHKGIAVRKGKPAPYTKAEINAVRSLYRSALWPHRPPAPIEGAVAVEVVWQYPAGTRHRGSDYKITRPDLDNLCKLLLDVMTEVGFWHDDAQVASLITRKIYAEEVGVMVVVQQLDRSLPGLCRHRLDVLRAVEPRTNAEENTKGATMRTDTMEPADAIVMAIGEVTP